MNTPTGTMRVSTPEATVLDLVSAPEHGGGLSNIATVIGDLLEDSKLDVAELTRIEDGWPATVVQRTGWLPRPHGVDVDTELNLDALAAIATSHGDQAKLVPSGGDGRLDHRWNLMGAALLEGRGPLRWRRARRIGTHRRPTIARNETKHASLTVTMRAERGIGRVGPCPETQPPPVIATRDGAKPSIHDANTPNGAKTTRPSARNRSAALRNAITPEEPHPNLIINADIEPDR